MTEPIFHEERYTTKRAIGQVRRLRLSACLFEERRLDRVELGIELLDTAYCGIYKLNRRGLAPRNQLSLCSCIKVCILVMHSPSLAILSINRLHVNRPVERRHEPQAV